MDILSPSALSVGTLVWEPRPGQRMLTVCVKVTFSLVDGQTSVLATPQEPIHADIPWDGTPGAALYAPSDFAPTKPRIDILLSGHVHAPGGRPAPQLVARVAVDDFSKALLVRGDQRWISANGGLHPGPVQPFVRMPLRYDQAGLRTDDPGFAGPESRVLGAPLPHFDRVPGGPSVESPAGFGPLAPSVRARRVERGEEIQRWARSLEVREHKAPPVQLDWSFFNSAPRDQQIAELGPAPRIVLENLHPSIPRLETRLPAMAPRVLHLEPGRSQLSEIRLRCDTLRIDTDRSRVTLSYRGTIPLGSKDERALGALGILLEGEGSAGSEGELLRLLRARTGIESAVASAGRDDSTREDAEEDEVGASTVTGTSPLNASVLPFTSAPPRTLPLTGPSNIAVRAPAAWASTPPVGSPDLDDDTMEAGRSTLPITRLTRSPALPFSTSDEDDEVGSSTLPIAGLTWTPALPFSTSDEDDEVGSSTLPIAGLAWTPASPFSTSDEDDEVGSSTLPITHNASMPASPFSTSDEDDEVGSSTLPITHNASMPALPFVKAGGEADEVSALPLRALPAVIPILEVLPVTEEIPTPSTVSAPAPPPPAPVPAPPPPAPAPARSISPTEISVELCATITAEIHERATEAAPILARHQCSADTWAEAQRLWASAMDEERRRGASAVQEAYDAAYVAQLERGRGPLQVEEYARLEVSIERGDAALALAELRLPHQALMPVQRLWFCRLLSEPGLLAKVQRARSAARSA